MNQRYLGKYQLQEPLGRSTIGEAWKAFDAQQSRTVIVTIITIKQETSSEFFPRFNSEGQAIAALHHPNIVHLQEFAIAPNGQEAYIVTDYVPGQSLADYLAATAHTGKIPAPVGIVQLLTPLAAALDYAHQQRVVHGALRPAAIILDRSRAAPSSLGEPMLSNFGMSQKQDPRLQPLDETSYMAPEVAQGNPATRASDLYSLGVMLYELCTGTLPFQAETSSDVLMQHIHSVPTSPVLINPHIRPALTGIILRSIARDPAARFSSATALVSAVAKAMNIRMPESTSQSYPAQSTANPSSWSGINEQDNPTYLSSPPLQISSSQPALSPPPVVSSNTPAWQPPTVIASATPVLPSMFQVSGAYPVIATNSPMPGAASVPPISTQIVPPPLIPADGVASPARKRRIRGGFVVLTVVLIVVLLGSALLLHLVFPATQQPAIVGHAFFLSSGLINTGSNQGITDGLHISLQNVRDPQPGKRYYGWLTSNSGIDTPALSLGSLSVEHGQITTTHYDPGHNNLLANYDRFLLTEEDASQQPANPSPDVNTWRYAAAFSTTANPTDPNHYSVLDHLRHLLSRDPKLSAAGLSGGLDVWLFRNTTKILEAAGSARDSEKTCIGSVSDDCTSFILRQAARILDYLDGAVYVRTENIPPNIQGDHLLIDPTIARVALLEFDPLHQQPPGYLEHIGGHLQNLKQTPDSTADQRALAIHISQDINNVQGWLTTVHKDASLIIHMSSTQLLQPETLTIFNDLFTQANTAFVGQIDPNTDNVKEGVVQIHYAIQALATFDIAPCTLNNGQSSCA